MKKHLIGAAVALAAVCSAHAADTGSSFKFLAGVGVAAGGDTLATVQFTDGTRQNVKAGGGGTFYAGGEYRGHDKFSIQATLGYHFQTTAAASNGDVTFSRIPVDLLAFYHLSDKLRIGGGLQVVNSPRLKGTGVANNIDMDFDTATGAVLEGEYLFTPSLGMKVRYVSQNYTETGTSNSANGNHLGLLLNFHF